MSDDTIRFSAQDLTAETLLKDLPPEQLQNIHKGLLYGGDPLEAKTYYGFVLKIGPNFKHAPIIEPIIDQHRTLWSGDDELNPTIHCVYLYETARDRENMAIRAAHETGLVALGFLTAEVVLQPA